MLSSITPLGQRARGNSWLRTVLAFWVGASATAVMLHGLLGLVGETTGVADVMPWVVLIPVVASAGLDLTGFRPWGPRRQVDEDWLGRYRDWVVGFGFGAQLGTGIHTHVPVWGVWGLLAASVLMGLPGAAIIGLGFAAGRTALLVATARVDRPERLAGTMAGLARFDRPAKGALMIGYLVVVVVGVVSVAA